MPFYDYLLSCLVCKFSCAILSFMDTSCLLCHAISSMLINANMRANMS